MTDDNNVKNTSNKNTNKNSTRKSNRVHKNKNRTKKKKDKHIHNQIGCRVLYSNVDNGINNKKGEILSRIDKSKPNIIGFTEIYPKGRNYIDNEPFEIPNYDIFINKNPRRGVALYIDSALGAIAEDTLNNHSFEESVWCSFQSNDNEKIIIGCIYKSPNTSDHNQQLLQDLLNSDKIQKYDKVCIMGDFNFPKLLWDGTDTSNQEFIESTRDAYLIQKVKNPTRDREAQKSNILDLVFVNDDDLIGNIDHEDPFGKSDHHVLVFDMNINSSIEDEERTYRYNLGKGKYKEMRETMQEINWENIKDMNLNDMWNEFKTSINITMKSFIPKIKVNNKRKMQPTWMNKKALRKIKKKHKLFKRFLTTKSGYHYTKYITARNKCKKEIKKAKKNNEKKIADMSKTDPKLFWKYVQEQTKTRQGIGILKGKDGKLYTDDKDRADILNDFFASVFTKEDDLNIPHLDESSRSQGISISDLRVTPEEVEKKLKELNPAKAQGPDGIPPKVLKELSKEIAIPLSLIFNKSLELGKIPDDWKTAVVTAIYKKKGSKNEPGNYRPVSLTCVLCKVLESFVRDKVVEHFTSNNLYAKCQHGFRKQRSCISQLLEVMEDFSLFIEQGNNIDIIYLDFKKAFDTVPHKRLLEKIKSYGILGNIYNWIEDFLSNRTQKVRVNNQYSRESPVQSGIPQGSILGPILFTIFINDLPDGIKSICKIFADDTKIYNDSNSYPDIQEDIVHLQNWSEKWKLFFNISKCKIMHIGNKDDQSRENYFMFDGQTKITIEECDQEKDLGVIFDETLIFDKHINSAINKANKMLGLIKRTFNYLNRETFLKLYKSMVRPHLEYGNIVWHPLYKRQSSSIEKVQRRATKILKECKNMTYPQRLNYLNLHTLKGRRLRGDLIEMYKIFNGLTDLDKDKMFKPATVDFTRNSESKVQQIHYKKKIRENVFSIRITPLWNKLPNTLKHAPSTNTFKNRLDGHDILQERFFEYDE